MKPIDDDLLRGALRSGMQAFFADDGRNKYPDPPALTNGIFAKMVGFGRANPYGLDLIEVEPTPIYGPVKKHRKRRIQKKWLKRYGREIKGYDRYLGDQIYIYGAAGVAFCHPDVAARARYEMGRDASGFSRG